MRSLFALASVLAVLAACEGNTTTPPGPDPAVCDGFAPADPYAPGSENDWNDPRVASCEAAGCTAFVGSTVTWDDEMHTDLYGMPGYCHYLLWGQHRDCAAETQPGFQVVNDAVLGTLTFGTPADQPDRCLVIEGDVLPIDWVACADPSVVNADECSP
ncbi:MAG: hypothetical protein H6737_28330 [Alphaproteobacteria bacterium]|nr:hypothetical protein [Alphaproteobacteria bacterium]